jgi:Glu-tRNA(Gln) amidotransferase subunit E-like FAD-binding protein
MAKDMFHDRERAEEAVYFSKQNAKLIEKLREKAKLSEIARALAEKLQVDNPALLERIMKLGVTLDTGAAFFVAPLIEIAWADGDISQAEHDAIVRLATTRGVAPGSADMRQILEWLANRPSDALLQAAVEAIKIGLAVLPREEAEQRIQAMISACEDVAQAAGGLRKLLGLHGRVSHEERTAIDEIRARLTDQPAG